MHRSQSSGRRKPRGRDECGLKMKDERQETRSHSSSRLKESRRSLERGEILLPILYAIADELGLRFEPFEEMNSFESLRRETGHDSAKLLWGMRRFHSLSKESLSSKNVRSVALLKQPFSSSYSLNHKVPCGFVTHSGGFDKAIKPRKRIDL